jgi:hypothetical protein
MRRLLPPFIGCRSQRQKEEAAHARAIAASSKLSLSARKRTRRMRRLNCRLFQAVAVSARKNRLRMRAPLSTPLIGCYSHRPKEKPAQTGREQAAYMRAAAV